MPGSYGASAIAAAGSAGRMYTSRLPPLSEKKITTSTTHASGNSVRASRARSARTQPGIAQGIASDNGSHSNAITDR